MKFCRIKLVQRAFGLDVKWVRAPVVGERSGWEKSGDIYGFWILLVVEVEEAITDEGCQ